MQLLLLLLLFVSTLATDVATEKQPKLRDRKDPCSGELELYTCETCASLSPRCVLSGDKCVLAFKVTEDQTDCTLPSKKDKVRGGKRKGKDKRSNRKNKEVETVVDPDQTEDAAVSRLLQSDESGRKGKRSSKEQQMQTRDGQK